MMRAGVDYLDKAVRPGRPKRRAAKPAKPKDDDRKAKRVTKPVTKNAR